MPRKKTGRRRGRPRKLHAKRRCTTKLGRRTGHDPVVEPTPQLIEKRRAVAGGRSDIELVDYPGILAANALVDVDELGTLRLIERWLGLVRRARGLSDGHVGRLWSQILAGQRGGRAHAVGGGTRPTAADTAWERLLALRAAFDELDLLPALEFVVAVAGGERGPQSRGELAALKVGIAGVAAWLRHGRRRDRSYAQQAR